VSKRKRQISQAAYQNDILSRQYELLQKAYADNAMLFHDMDHHLQTIYRLAEEGDNAAVMEYISRIGEPVRELSGILWTGVGIVDAILNEKKQLAGKKGYALDIDAELPANTGIALEDFCTILSNLLDNAIESMDRQLGNGFNGKDISAGKQEALAGPIRICLRRINHFLMIRVSNPCREQVRRRKGLFSSVKKDGMRHGWGLKSVKQAVLKYGGTLSCEIERDQFVATALLFFPFS